MTTGTPMRARASVYDGTDAADADDAHMETRDYALGFGAPGIVGAAQHGPAWRRWQKLVVVEQRILVFSDNANLGTPVPLEPIGLYPEPSAPVAV